MQDGGAAEAERGQEAGPSQVVKETYIPGAGAVPLEDGEQLDYDPSTYQMYHKLNTDFPCLSAVTIISGVADFPGSHVHVLQKFTSHKYPLPIMGERRITCNPISACCRACRCFLYLMRPLMMV